MVLNDRTNDMCFTTTPFVSTIHSRRTLSSYHSPIWQTLPETLFRRVTSMVAWTNTFHYTETRYRVALKMKDG